MLRQTLMRNGGKWGHQARPYFCNGLIYQELTHTQAKLFPNPMAKMSSRWNHEKPNLTCLAFAGAIYGYIAYYMEDIDYHYGLGFIKNLEKYHSNSKIFDKSFLEQEKPSRLR